jgi:hypothetical protein
LCVQWEYPELTTDRDLADRLHAARSEDALKGVVTELLADLPALLRAARADKVAGAAPSSSPEPVGAVTGAAGQRWGASGSLPAASAEGTELSEPPGAATKEASTEGSELGEEASTEGSELGEEASDEGSELEEEASTEGSELTKAGARPAAARPGATPYKNVRFDPGKGKYRVQVRRARGVAAHTQPRCRAAGSGGVHGSGSANGQHRQALMPSPSRPPPP